MSIVDKIHLIKIRDGINHWKVICKKLEIEPTQKKINSMKSQYSRALTSGRFTNFVIPEKPKKKSSIPKNKKVNQNLVDVDLLLKLISSDNFLDYIKDKEKHAYLYKRCKTMKRQPDAPTMRKVIIGIKEMIPELIKNSK